MLLLVEHGQGVIGSRQGLDVVDPAHEDLLIGGIARRREAVIVVAAHAHNVPVAHAIVVAVARVIEVGQSQAVAKLVGKRADAVDGLAVVVAAVQLVEHGKRVDIGVTAVGTEGSVAAIVIVGSGIQRPVAGPDGLGIGR